MNKPDFATCTWREMGAWLHQLCAADPHCWRPRRMIADLPEAEAPPPDDGAVRALGEQVASLRKTVGQLENELRAVKARATDAPRAARPKTKFPTLPVL